MKNLLLLILLFSSISFGQEKFQPVIMNQCSGEVIDQNEVPSITISDGKMLYRQFPLLDIYGFRLSKTGRHVLTFSNSPDSVAFQYDPSNQSADTFYLPALETWFMISNPPIVTYTFCGEDANGIVEDYYFNGNLRKRGKFEDGNLIDTLFSYHSNGQLSEVMVNNTKDGYSQKTFYENGQLENNFDSKKRTEKSYYQNGQIHEDVSWNRKYKYKIKTYRSDGSLKGELRKNQKFYFENDTLKSILKSKRQMYTMLRDWFTVKKYKVYGSWYNCTWKHFDSNGEITRKEKFQQSGRFGRYFPDSLGEDQYDLIDKILFYENGKPVYKIESDYRKVNGEYKSRVVCYRRENRDWIEESESDDETLPEKINHYSFKRAKL